MKRSCLAIFLFLLISAYGYGQSCTLAVAVSSSNPTICSGNQVILTAAPTSGTAPYSYTWSTGETTPSITVDKAGTYKVTVVDKTPGCAGVVKNITVGASATPNAPSAASVIVCPNSTATLKATAPGGVYQWYDAPTGGNFLGSGATFTTQPITTPTPFYVQTTLGGCTSARTMVYAYLTGKPNVTNATVCTGNSATLTADGGSSYEWYDAATGGNLLATTATFTTPVLTKTATYYVVAAINGCTSARTAATAFVASPPQKPVAQNVTVCAGSPANLHADAPAGIFSWYASPSGGTPLIISPDYTTPPLTATTTYYVQNALNGCESALTAVKVTVNPLPATPASQTDTTCYGTGTTLTVAANPAGNYQWYDSSTGGNLLATSVSFNTPALTYSTNYYVQADNGGCASPRALITVIVKSLPQVPSVSGSIVCYGSSTTLTAKGPGGNYQWFDAATGGNLLSTKSTFTTPALKTTATYYIQTTFGGCTSPRTPVIVTVNPPVDPPFAAGTTVCSGSPATLTATGAGSSYTWYDSNTGGNLLSSSQVFVTPSLSASTTYYVETNLNGCISQRTPVTVTVNSTPAAPVSSGTTICPGSSANLTASATGGTIQWYDQPTGGNVVATGTSYATPVLTANTTYYLQNNIGDCISARTPVTVSVNGVPQPQYQYPQGSVCASATSIKPIIYNPAGGTFSAEPGLVFKDNTTGEIDVTKSTPGAYNIVFTGNGTCSVPTKSSFLIFTIPDADFTYNQSYCQDDTNPFPFFSSGGGDGIFSATPAGLVFIDPTTGEIDLKKSKPGTYKITNDIAASGTCAGNSSNASITIYQSVTVNAGPDQIVAKGAPVQLNGKITGVTGGKWSGGTGTFSDPSIMNPIYTPSAGENSAVLTLTSNDPAGPCGPKSSAVTITFNSTLLAPTVSVNTMCLGSSAILSATAPGGTYRWYDALVGGNLLNTGAVYTTPPLTTNATFYVETTVDGVVSPRATVQVTVNAIPVAPVAPGTTSCQGSPANLAASGSAGSYQWYDSPVGGNLLSVSNTYVTAPLLSNQSYYVQTTVNGCVSDRTKVDVLVTPVPTITSPPTAIVCSGNTLTYSITSNVASATFLWSRAAVAGISNPAVTTQTSATINETLVDTGSTAVNVIYTIVPVANGCSGPSFSYVVTVNPTPSVTGAAKTTICNGTSGDYQINFNTTVAGFEWSRAAVAGISNAAVSGQAANTIREDLFNTTNKPIDVTYLISAKTNTCTGPPFSLVVTVEPSVTVTSLSKGTACSGSPQSYEMASNIAGAIYTWKRDAVNNISNAAVSNQTSSIITESLTNTGTSAVKVTYVITPIANGCPGTPFNYVVTVNPEPITPVANSNSPVCVGSTIQLRTPVITGATYMWAGPNGFTSSVQNPNIDNVSAANLGTYNLYISINGCTSPAGTVAVVVKDPPLTNAGPDQDVCITETSVQLAGKISGGTTTGIWGSSGTGTFSPSPTDLNATYSPSAQDKANGSVTLTLASTSNDDCHIATSSMTIKFAPKPGVTAGPNQSVCSQTTTVPLNGKVLIAGGGNWSTSGAGSFNPSADQLDATYMPSATDIKNGTVTLTLHASAAGQCFIATDSLIVKFIDPPTVNAGGTRFVLKGNTIILMPTVSDPNVKYLWSPNIDIDNDTLKNPVITGDVDRVYTLQVTDSRGCASTDQATIKVSPLIEIPNTFTPNGDGVNDQWNIQGLVAYQSATIDIFDRYGQKLYHSIGYPKAWDGTYGGKELPVGVYYYIIDTKMNNQVLSGSITIIR